MKNLMKNSIKNPMKTLFKTSLMACLLAASCANAGMDANNSDYDIETGVYVQPVTAMSTSQSGDTIASSYSKSGDYQPNINLFIYNPKDGAAHHLLDNNYGEISTYVVETAFQASADTNNNTKNKTGQYIYMAGNNKVQNNMGLPQRPINNNILLETYFAKTKTYTVWKANKLTSDSKVLFSYQAPSQWHIDVKNQTVRLITPFMQNKQVRLKVTNFAW